MDAAEVINVDRTAEGVLATFANGDTFLFPSNFRYKVRPKEGQITGGPPERL